MISLVSPDLHRLDLGGVNAYLWTGAAGPTLIDAGMPGSFQTLLHDLAAVGVQPADLQRIILTHADLDHIGGVKALAQLTSARILCHTAEAAYVRGEKSKGPTPSLLGYLIRPFFALVYRRYRPAAPRVDQLLLDGETLPEGFTVVHMPGHSPGQIALHHAGRGILIAGDALNNRGDRLHLPPPLFTPQMAAARESLARLSKYSFEIACFGHGPPLVGGADAAIAAFVRGAG